MDQGIQGGPTIPPPLPVNSLPVEHEKDGTGGKEDDDEKQKLEKEKEGILADPGNNPQQQQQSPHFSIKETNYSEGNVKLKIGLQAKRMKKPPKILENYVCRPAFRATIRHGSRGGGRGRVRAGVADGCGNSSNIPHIKEEERGPFINQGLLQSSCVSATCAPTPSQSSVISTFTATAVNGSTQTKKVNRLFLKKRKI